LFRFDKGKIMATSKISSIILHRHEIEMIYHHMDAINAQKCKISVDEGRVWQGRVEFWGDHSDEPYGSISLIGQQVTYIKGDR